MDSGVEEKDWHKETVDVINQYFPEGDSRRGDAMIIAGVCRIAGREEMRNLILNRIEDKKNVKTS